MNTNDKAYLVQKIRTQYTEKTYTALDELKTLDQKVKRPAHLFGWLFGSVGALVLGAGMSLIMTDLGATMGLASAMVPGIGIGVAGLVMVLVNYPIYKQILQSRRDAYADEIIALSDRIARE